MSDSPQDTFRTAYLAMLAALPLEVRPFLRRIAGARRLRDLGLPAWEFQAREGKGILGLSGMGAVAAWEAARRLLERCRPAAFVSLGFGGALAPGLEPGTLVLGESFWHFHPDSGRLEKIPAPAPPRPLAELTDCLQGAGLRVCRGSLVTTAHIIHKERQGGPISHLPCPVLDLESAAAAAALADQGGVPFLGLRVITDGAEEEIPAFLRRTPGQGPDPGVGAALGWVGANPRRLAHLLRFWRRGRSAARRLAEALEALLPLF